MQDYEIVQCYSSTLNCVSNTNGVSLAAIDCCSRASGGYLRHSSFTGAWQSAQCSPLCIGELRSILIFLATHLSRLDSNITNNSLLVSILCHKDVLNCFTRHLTVSLPMQILPFDLQMLKGSG